MFFGNMFSKFVPVMEIKRQHIALAGAAILKPGNISISSLISIIATTTTTTTPVGV